MSTAERMEIAMSKDQSSINNSEKLLSYIMSLTPEQVEKIINHLPRLTALLEESCQPYPLEQSSQIQSA